MSTLGERIREARQARGLAQHDLARASGVSQGHISRTEGGKRSELGPSVVGALAEALGVSLEWLLTGEGPRDRRPEQTVDLDGDLDPTIVKVGKAIDADPRDIRAASDVRAAWGTASLSELRAKELLETVARARRDDERAAQLAELEAAAGVKAIRRGALVDVPEDDDTFGAPKPKKPKK